jgi:hypothetical protein
MLEVGVNLNLAGPTGPDLPGGDELCRIAFCQSYRRRSVCSFGSDADSSCRSGDRPPAAEPGQQRLGHQWRQSDQPALFDPEADRHRQCQAAQGSLDDPPQGSGFGGKYSFEGTPLVKDGVMYIVTGNDDVFALNAKTGDFLWER